MAQSGCSVSGLQQMSYVLCPPSQCHRHAVTLAMCPLPHPPPLTLACLHHFCLLQSAAEQESHCMPPFQAPSLGSAIFTVFLSSVAPQLTSHCCPPILHCLELWPVHSSPAGLVACIWLWAVLNTDAGCIQIAGFYFPKAMAIRVLTSLL